MAKQIANAASELGNDKIMVASFTNAAALELAGRELPVRKHMVGTLHHHAYAAIGPGTPIAETPNMIEEWNRFRPDYSLSGGNRDVDDLSVGANGKRYGDVCHSFVQVLRARMVPTDMWPNLEGGSEALNFYEKWCEFKKSVGAIDFTDMIEFAIRDTTHHPDNPSIGFFDEFQDFTRLEAALCEHWAKAMPGGMVISGDPNQCIYTFKGSSPRFMLDNVKSLPKDDQYELRRSWRVPRLAQMYASNWITRAKAYVPADYETRDEIGALEYRTDINLSTPELIVSDIEKRLDETVYDEHWKTHRPVTIMVQATCSYMLDPLKHELRSRGLPFHNPYRKSRNDWNPLSPGKGVSASERILALLRPDNAVWGDRARMWNGEDIHRIISAMNATGNLRKGAKDKLDKLAKTTYEFKIDELLEYFEEAALDRMLAGDVDWYKSQLQKSRQAGAEFAFNVFNRHGPKKLVERPQVAIGTIHSFKGTQADIVYVAPDLPFAGFQQMIVGNEEQTDAIIRTFYVAFTRCRASLVLVGPAGRYCVDFPTPTKV